MRRLFAALIGLLLLGGWACAEAPFVFQNALGWDSTREEALAWLGEGAEADSDATEGYGNVETLVADDRSFGGLPCARVSITYFDGQMAGIFCYFKNAEIVDPLRLLDAVAAEYGEPTRYGTRSINDTAPSVFDTFCVWDLADGETRIGFYTYTRGGARYPYDQCIAFEHTPVMERLNAQSETFQAEQAASN